jgi:RES domain-containing protein
MLPTPALDKALQSTPTPQLTAPLYRAVHLKYLRGLRRKARPLHALGSSRNGGRFTPKGGPVSLYGAERPDTAFWEANQVASSTGAVHVPSTVVFSVTARIDSYLDLIDPAVRAALGTTRSELLLPWKTARRPETQRLGQRVWRSRRYQAIRYPSARHPGGVCWAVFVSRVLDPSFIEMSDPAAGLFERIPAKRPGKRPRRRP